MHLLSNELSTTTRQLHKTRLPPTWASSNTLTSPGAIEKAITTHGVGGVSCEIYWRSGSHQFVMFPLKHKYTDKYKSFKTSPRQVSSLSEEVSSQVLEGKTKLSANNKQSAS